MAAAGEGIFKKGYRGLLNKQRFLSGMSLYDIRDETGLSYSTVQNAFNGNRNNTTLANLTKICKAIGCKHKDLLKSDEEITGESNV